LGKNKMPKWHKFLKKMTIWHFVFPPLRLNGILRLLEHDLQYDW
jgi:hypothetical protein